MSKLQEIIRVDGYTIGRCDEEIYVINPHGLMAWQGTDENDFGFFTRVPASRPNQCHSMRHADASINAQTTRPPPFRSRLSIARQRHDDSNGLAFSWTGFSRNRDGNFVKILWRILRLRI